ncbi:hypothetical protein K0810_08965 [Erysipelothrix rhusiopathiae]|uniref:Carrier domain-containing protein n=1 Tax=Erysipelothrix rhusiopathiae ATCC 19414 TaxID=525280 RepID=E7FTU6_ERYRH|nr:hypothetical protein [Erysipelothrix rhusiopathiae]UPU39432.1 hypothetical protein MX850_01130 [Erysipelothrix sp. Poltava]AGN23885.1 hypothetical protein K210_01230 [Erysipelothrix rhusiopathiae SY1027]AMS11310.1 hypothetical protein A2I91_06035 [Erysipelothrix rhusiopathiae]AOO67807.1 hypothetical protein BC346_05555 [Erysipelothrix rhusiopathiae]AWU41336.1 hypothetical protein DM789_03550 [Erysipelothrix rhusiopathiae]
MEHRSIYDIILGLMLQNHIIKDRNIDYKSSLLGKNNDLSPSELFYLIKIIENHFNINFSLEDYRNYGLSTLEKIVNRVYNLNGEEVNYE